MDKDNMAELNAWWDGISDNKTEFDGVIQRLIQKTQDDYRAELLAGSGEPVAVAENHLGKVRWEMSVRRWPLPLYTADQQAAAVLREREKAEHWKNECRKVIRTYVVADEAWDVDGEVEKQMARCARGGK